jgi:hypothetical protein
VAPFTPFHGLPCFSMLRVLCIHYRFSADDLAAAHSARLTDDLVPKLNLRSARFAQAITYGKGLLCQKAK